MNNKDRLSNLVSVITPAYNAESSIKECIEAVAKQSIKIKEHIIVDDGSSDNTILIIKELTKKYPHIKLITQNNQGAGAARNKAITLASGRYIAFLDSDDTWLDKKLEVQISLMESKGYLFTYGNYYRKKSGDIGNGTMFTVPSQLSYRELLTSCPIGCLTAVYNQEVKGKVYMSKIRRGQDWSLWLSLTKDGTNAYAYDGCLAIYNDMPGTLSKNRYKKFYNLFEIYRENGFSRPKSLCLTLVHSVKVIFRKI